MKKSKIGLFIIAFLLDAMVFSFYHPIRSNAEKKSNYDTLLENGPNSYDDPNVLGSPDIKLLGWNNERIDLEFVVPQLIVEEKIEPTGEVYHQLNIDGGGCLDRIGQPKIPFRTLRILLPSGTDLEDIEITAEERHTLEGTYKIEPAQAQVPIGLNVSSRFTLDKSVYDSVNPYPTELYSVVGVYEFRGYRILILNLYPVSYIPQTGKITYYDEMKVLVNLNDCSEMNRLFRALKNDEERIMKKVDNPQLINTYTSGLSPRKGSYSPTALPPASYDYVIITSEALKNSGGAYTFQDLVASKAAKGIAVNITTVEYIYSNYAGADNQAQIRNFIIDAYATWGIEYVLLGGDGDGANTGGESGAPIIPARSFYDDFSEVDTNIPSDLYYAGLDGTWNNDGDSYWGEEGEDDLYAEVYVGRAPVDSEAELSNFVYKTLSHESSVDTYLFEALMVGEDLGWTSWGWQYKDEIKNGCDLYGYTTVGIPGDVYNVETLYDTESYSWAKSELIDRMNGGVHIINHLGHANVNYVMKMYNPDVDSSLTNDKYFFAYSQGCYDGAFDNRGTGGTYGTVDCIVEHFVTTQHGAFAFIGNSRYGWGNGGSTDGASQHYDREFFDAIYAEGIDEIGRANQDSKEDSIGFITTSNPMRWCYYEANLFGDPMAIITVNRPHDLGVSLEVPTDPKISKTYTVNATVTNKGDNDETGVQFFFYLDKITVASTTIPTLHVDESVTLNYPWKPTLCRNYNFTAYAEPVPGETYVGNNIKTELVDIITDLGVSLEVTTDPKISKTYTVNATVTNKGDNNVTDVQFFFYLDKITVASTTIPTLHVDESVTLNYPWKPTRYGSYNFTAYAEPVPGEIDVGNNIKTELVKIVYRFWHDNFESGLSNWETPTGLWHLTDTSSKWGDPCHSPIHSMWYGQELSGNYNNGTTNSGNLSSVPIDLSSLDIAYLELYHWKQTEQFSSYDHTYVYVTKDGSIWNLIYSNYIDVGPWEKLTFNISSYCGTSSFQIRFYFNTVDSVYNDYRGWLVDDISIIIPPNTAPNAPANPVPADGATGVSHNPMLSVQVSDPDGDSMVVSFYNASDKSLIGTIAGVASGATASVTWAGLSGNMVYSWYVNASDVSNTTQSAMWSFTTAPNTAPNEPANPIPADGGTAVSLNPTLSVQVSDPEEDSMSVSFYNASDNSLIGTVSGVASGGTASVTWAGLSGNTVYAWYAVASDGSASTQSFTWSFTSITAPTAPQNLQATAGAGNVTLTWKAPASNGGSPVTNYIIYRGTSSGAEVYLTKVGNVTTFTDTGLTAGQTYYYKVSAVNAAGEGAKATEVNATTATVTSAPLNLQATASTGQITLTWQAPSSNGGSPVTNYKIYRSTSSGGEVYLTTVDNVTTFTDTGLTTGQTYYYKVVAVNAVGDSVQSTEGSATVPPETGPEVPGYPMVLVGLISGATFVVLYKRRLPAKKTRLT